MPKRALVRQPGARYTGCISSHPLRGTVDVSLARVQHSKYCDTLKDLGIEVITIPRDDEHPDACFVEDNAVIHRGKALICRMAKESRRGEEDAVKKTLDGYMEVKRAAFPATVAQTAAWLGVAVDTIVEPGIVHLKSYVTYLGKNTMIATRRYANHPTLEGFNVLVVPEDEGYAANTLALGDTVLMPKGRPRAQSMVLEAGFDVIDFDVSEFEKCEGALTCLSLLF